MNANPIRLFLFLSVALAAGCANGDGRGYGTVSGTMTVSLEGETVPVGGDEVGTITALTIGVGAARLETAESAEGGENRLLSLMPIGAHWAPLAGEASIPFGPYEIDQGDYVALSAIITRVDVTIEVGERELTREFVWPEGLPVSSALDLAVNRDRPPNIILTTELVVNADAFARVDFEADDATEQVAAGLQASGAINVTWVRKKD